MNGISRLRFFSFPGRTGAVVLLLALAALWLAAAPEARAQDNVIRVDPTGVEVAPDGSFEVAIIADPPAGSLAIWVVEVAFDPDVLSTTSRDCDPINTPGGAIGAFQCIADDTDDDGTNDTVKILGAVLFTGTGTGLIKESTLADITFDAIGDPGDCTDLTLRIRTTVDNNAEETGALVQDGRACIEADAPPSGTASPVPFTPRTSAPTPPGESIDVPTIGGNGETGQETPETGEPGDTGQTSTPAGQSGSTGATGASAAGTTPATAPNSGANYPDDDGGVATIVWVVIGLFALGAAAVGAWAIVRVRGGTPPGD